MKKWLSLLLGLLLTLIVGVFAGCEDLADSSSESSSATTGQVQTTDKYASRLNDSTMLTCNKDSVSVEYNQKTRAWNIDKNTTDNSSYNLYLNTETVQKLISQGKTALRITFDTRVASELGWLEVIGEKADRTGTLRLLRINNSGKLTIDTDTLDMYYEMPLTNAECDYSKQIFLVLTNRAVRIYFKAI